MKLASVALFSSVLVASAPLSRGSACAQAVSAQDFVNKVAISDMFEIQSSRLALSKNPGADTKPFADKMVADHEKTSSELKSLVNSGKVKATLPTDLDSEHLKMFEELKGKTGQDFDRSYDAMQLKGHREAVALFRVTRRPSKNSCRCP